jgi:REP element-mobilizing transposase RayT
MPQERRRYISGAVYEICFRAKEGIPLPPNRAINALIEAVVARVQRDEKLTLCHYYWSGNHTHMLVRAKDSDQFSRFLGETKRRITTAVKQLCGFDFLNLWEIRVTVAHTLTVDTVISRIAYFYANPSNDNLEDSIEKYPGLSTFKDFLQCKDSLSASITDWIPQFKVPALPKIGTTTIGIHEEREILKALNRITHKKVKKHNLTRYPNDWMKAFGITDNSKVREINEEILKKVRESEEVARQKRKELGKSVMGAAKLRRQSIMTPHTPKKKDRKIYVICNDREMRVAAIREQKEFSIRCRECYQRALRGEVNIEWPAGAFRPPMRPQYNVLYCPDDELPLSISRKSRQRDFRVAE